MKNRDNWKPSKYVYRNGELFASKNQKEVGIGSRLMANLIAGVYDKHLRLHAKGKLLDLGCGKVPLFFAYKDFVSDNICVDWANSVHKNEYLDFECDLTRPLPFGDAEFDTIILSDVLEHIPEPELLWKEMSRVLATDGKIMVNVPFIYCLHELPHDYYRFTEFALRRFVDNAGLRLIHFETVGGTPEIMADILAKHFQFIPLIGRSLAIGVQYITGFFLKTRIGKKLSKKTGQAFPFGYFLVAEKSR